METYWSLVTLTFTEPANSTNNIKNASQANKTTSPSSKTYQNGDFQSICTDVSSYGNPKNMVISYKS